MARPLINDAPPLGDSLALSEPRATCRATLSLHERRSGLLPILCGLWLLGLAGHSTLFGAERAGRGSKDQYGPAHPEVVKMVRRGVGFLEKNGVHERLGGKALLGLALVKASPSSADHPKVQEAVAACVAAADSLEAQHRDDALYDLGLAIIFLCEHDPDQHRPAIQKLVKLLLKWQRSYGGWGYLKSHPESADTSMTQYGVLALWTADRSGAVPVDPSAAARVTNWLIRTQDPGGGWGYQGVDPGQNSSARVNQYGIQHSLSAAGCGSTYVMGDLLGLTGGMFAKGGETESAVRSVASTAASDGAKPRPKRGPLTNQVDRSRLRSAMEGGDSWFRQNFTAEAEDYIYYYLYALERYQSFRELAANPAGAELKWYDAGVEYLKKQQRADGSWNDVNGPTVDTSFAVLFLVRGTQRMIAKAEAYNGRLRGGRGLPGTTGDLVMNADGQIVKTPFQGQAEGLLSLLESGAAMDWEEDAGRDYQVSLSDEPTERAAQLDRLRRLVTAEEFGVRMAALRALISTRELDNVPWFILALGDPDPRMVLEAHRALRLLSRQIDGFQLPADPSDGAKREAIEFWKKWYVTLRPDAQFLN